MTALESVIEGKKSTASALEEIPDDIVRLTATEDKVLIDILVFHILKNKDGKLDVVYAFKYSKLNFLHRYNGKQE